MVKERSNILSGASLLFSRLSKESKIDLKQVMQFLHFSVQSLAIWEKSSTWPAAVLTFADALECLQAQGVFTQDDKVALQQAESILQLMRHHTSINQQETVSIDGLRHAFDVALWGVIRPLWLLLSKWYGCQGSTSVAAMTSFQPLRKKSTLARFILVSEYDEGPSRALPDANWYSLLLWFLLSNADPSCFDLIFHSVPIEKLTLRSLEKACDITILITTNARAAEVFAPTSLERMRTALSSARKVVCANGETVNFVRGEKDWDDCLNNHFILGRTPLAPKRAESPLCVALSSTCKRADGAEVIELKAGPEWLQTIAEVSKQSQSLPAPGGIIPRGNEYGRHSVVSIPAPVGKFERLYLRENPEWPGMEAAVNTLIRLIAGYDAAPWVDLWGLRHESQPPDSRVPFLISTEVKGETLQDALKRSPNGRLSNLDFSSFCRLVVATILVNPEDGKPDNYIVVGDERSGQRVVSIDNDHSFVEPFYIDGALAKTKRLQVKTILFCFDEMMQPVHEDTLAYLERVNVPQLMLQWLSRCQQHDWRFNAVFPDSTWERLLNEKSENGGNHTLIPVQLTHRALVQTCDKLLRLQRAVKRHRKVIDKDVKLSLMELLRAADPLLAAPYESAMWRLPSSTPAARFLDLTAAEYKIKQSSNQTLQTQTGLSKLMTQSLGIYGAEKDQPRLRVPELIDRVNHLISGISKLDLVKTQFASNNFDAFRSLASDALLREVVIWQTNWQPHLLPKNDPRSQFDVTAGLKTLVDCKCSFGRLQLRGYAVRSDAALLKKLFKNMSMLIRLDLSESPLVDDSLPPVLAERCRLLQQIFFRKCDKLTKFLAKPTLGFGQATSLEFQHLIDIDFSGSTNLKELRLDARNLRVIHIWGTQLVADTVLLTCTGPYCSVDTSPTIENLSFSSPVEELNMFAVKPYKDHDARYKNAFPGIAVDLPVLNLIDPASVKVLGPISGSLGASAVVPTAKGGVYFGDYLNNEVVVKRINLGMGATPQMIGNLIREISTRGTLRPHPLIAGFYGVSLDQTNKTFSLIYDYYPARPRLGDSEYIRLSGLEFSVFKFMYGTLLALKHMCDSGFLYRNVSSKVWKCVSNFPFRFSGLLI